MKHSHQRVLGIDTDFKVLLLLTSLAPMFCWHPDITYSDAAFSSLWSWEFYSSRTHVVILFITSTLRLHHGGYVFTKCSFFCWLSVGGLVDLSARIHKTYWEMLLSSHGVVVEGYRTVEFNIGISLTALKGTVGSLGRGFHCVLENLFWFVFNVFGFVARFFFHVFSNLSISG